MRAHRDEKLTALIQKLSSEFISHESTNASLLTVTKVSLSDDGKRCIIFFSTLPEEKEKTALEFLKRKRAEMREFIMKKSKIGRVPFFDVAIDIGERNRQRIEEIEEQI